MQYCLVTAYYFPNIYIYIIPCEREKGERGYCAEGRGHINSCGERSLGLLLRPVGVDSIHKALGVYPSDKLDINILMFIPFSSRSTVHFFFSK